MFLVDLDQSIIEGKGDELLDLAEAVEYLANTKGSRQAFQMLVNGVGLVAHPGRNESYYRPALDYHLGLLYAHAGQIERAADCFERSNVGPSATSNAIFSDQVRLAGEIQKSRVAAAKRGMPPILIASMPRSASASLTQTIAATFDMPTIRLSAGHFPNFALVPRWARIFAAGGAVTHDHFGASPFNLRVLKESRLRTVFILARDPRASAASIVNRNLMRGGRTYGADWIEMNIAKFAYERQIPWLNAWAAADDSGELQLNWISSLEMRADMGGTLRRVIETLQQRFPALADLIDRAPREVKANFVTGDDNAWRKLVSPETQRRLFEAISPRAVELLSLKP